MKIVVIGGSGLIGKKTVANLRQRGHEVLAASPSSGVNTVTGEGLAPALAGAQVVVDVANAPVWEDSAVLAFFETSGRNLLAAEAVAGVRHHVALSVVGTDRLLASGYFRAKMAQERLIKASPIPYTIVRATQFFEFVGGIAQAATEGETVRLPPALMQPIVSDDVAAVMADMALSEPLNGTFDLAGPEPIRQDDLVRKFLQATGDPRAVVTDPKALYYGIAVNDQTLTQAITRASARHVSTTGCNAKPNLSISMHTDTAKYNKALPPADRKIAGILAREIDKHLPEAENKIWHAHPVWFLEGNPVVGYSKLKDCVRLLFWSGQSFDEEELQNEGSFQAAEARYTDAKQVDVENLQRWLAKARDIQWDYKNIVRRKGKLERLK